MVSYLLEAQPLKKVSGRFSSNSTLLLMPDMAVILRTIACRYWGRTMVQPR